MMIEMADFDLNEARVLHFRGRLTLARLGDIPARLRALALPPVQIDLCAVERMDTVGAWIVHQLMRDHHATVTGASPAQSHLIAQMAAADKPVNVAHIRYNAAAQVLAEVGEAIFKSLKVLSGLVGFLGAILVAIFSILSTPAKFRWHAVVQCFDNVGFKALGIIGLMSFMIGLVIAEQGAAQLRANGLEIFTINLIGRLSLRELGVLMTAIMVAGRSGAAFAAQIGTMKLNEEIDAMRTIGVSPIEALVLPRVMACTLMMPLLGFYAAIISIIGGGLFCWLNLGIPPVTFVARLREVVALYDVWVGLIKAPVFGLIIGMTGCYQGMLVENDAEQVGLRTTSAVVQAIFIVIVLDAFFAVFFTRIGWV